MGHTNKVTITGLNQMAIAVLKTAILFMHGIVSADNMEAAKVNTSAKDGNITTSYVTVVRYIEFL